MEIKYKPNGVCSKEMTIEVENDIILNYSVVGGCPGNSKGLGALIRGMNIDEAIERLDGIKCGFKDTSCPDQLAKALKSIKEKV